MELIDVLGLISIGLTIGLIIAVLLYFFIRDLNVNQYKTMSSLSYRTLLKNEYLHRENVPFEKIEKYSS